MKLLCMDPHYQDLVNPMQGLEDLGLAKCWHIPLHYTHVKDDGTVVLQIMRAPNLTKPFDLKQVVQYVLIFGRPGMENTWQGIAVDFAYQMHWRTLFGFALCHALCANSTGKTTLVRCIALVMARPGLYRKAIIAYNKVYKKPFVAQHGVQLTIYQLHVPDDQVRNFLDEDALCVLLYNRIPPEWMDHAYTYGVVYLEQQFHQPTMLLDNFHEVDNEHLERLQVYGTPPAIPEWNGWREMTEED
ncbi:hypothetical protein C0992_009365, partial [Termitomyces sp. T32_za158]